MAIIQEQRVDEWMAHQKRGVQLMQHYVVVIVVYSGGTSLPKLLEEHRGIKRTCNQPDLSVDQILRWVDGYLAKHGKPPMVLSGEVAGTSDTFAKRSTVR